MAAFDRFSNIYDIALKPRLLRILLKEQLPDENRPVGNPLGLPSIVSTVRIHKLLSESVDAPADKKKHVESWKSAVDAWVDRIQKLVSSDVPDKCWAGICLLGVTCCECSASRFLRSYAVWFDELLSHIQLAGGSQFVKVASCASASDLLTRLGGFSIAKKDGTSLAGKLVPSILKLLNEDRSAAVWGVAASLLLTIITFFPSSVHRHHDNVETALVSKIVTGNCSTDLLEKFARCLALLPKSRGDADSWFQLLQKILLSISFQLNEALEGLEEESKRGEAFVLLVQPGKDPPPPLGGQTVGKDASSTLADTSRQSLVSIISSLMQCCSTMLTSSYPVQVTVPVRPLLVIIQRVLLVDGSLPQSFPYTTVMQQEFVCHHLPTLHHYSLEVLAAVVKGIHSQLLPHAADIVRLLLGYLRRCRFPELRIKVYSIIKTLLVSMGVGVALYLSQETVNSAVADLNAADTVTSNVILQSCAGASRQPHQKKRKHTSTVMSEEQNNALNVEVEGCKDSQPVLALKIAALEAIEAVLTVGGSLGNDSWRSKIDDLLMSVATRACKMGWAHNDENVSLPNVLRATWADYQLAALRALLASLIAPARVRPPYLAQGFQLFRKGKQAAGTKIAEFCAHALLVLEVLIHPRGLPLVDFPSSRSTDTFVRLGNSGYPKRNLPFNANGIMSAADPSESDEDDFLDDMYLQNGNANAPMPEVDKAIHVEKETSRDQDVGKHAQGLVDASGGGEEVLEERGQDETLSPDPEREKKTNNGEASREPENLPVPVRDSSQEPVSCQDAISGDLVMRSSSGEDKNLVHTRPDGDVVMLSHVELDDNLSSDSFPDIVDGDPDLESE
ncbi:hypothetical protein Dimus_006856 [Dionaea muscipula]